jgi:hypothetical protein
VDLEVFLVLQDLKEIPAIKDHLGHRALLVVEDLKVLQGHLV